MPLSETPTISQFPVWADDQGTNPVQRYSPMVTPQNIRDRQLFGIPLVSAFTGQQMSDDTLQEYINQAVSEVEHTLDLYVTPVEFQEKHDFNKEFWMWSFAYIKAYHPNIISVSDVSISFNNAFPDKITGQPSNAISFPKEHVHVMPQEGVIQMVPATGTTLGGFVLSVFFGVQFHAMRLSNILEYPGSVRITYKAGFQDGKIPSMIVGLVEVIAAYKALTALGPVLFPHNSVSVGIDGVSQSTSTLGPAFFKQRLMELEKLKNDQMEAAKGYYQRKFLIDYI